MPPIDDPVAVAAEAVDAVADAAHDAAEAIASGQPETRYIVKMLCEGVY